MNKRVSRWKRQKNVSRISLQPRDREIMVTVFSFRVLLREQIETLFGINCTRRLNIRLRKLYDHRYLSRSFIPAARGSSKAVYYLGPRGAAIVAEELDIDAEIVKQKRKSTSRLKELFLAHALELNDVRIAISRSVNNHPDMKLETWINDNDCEQEYHIAGSGNKTRKRFRPDGYFRLVYKNKLYSFFLEYDRSTMTLKRFVKKAETYLEFSNLGYYRQRFGVKHFRVLVITKSAKRLDNLKLATEKITDRYFYFTTRDRITETVLFASVWQRAGQPGNYSLIQIGD